jgi:DNA-binding NarL/FixJ family response regulator
MTRAGVAPTSFGHLPDAGWQNPARLGLSPRIDGVAEKVAEKRIGVIGGSQTWQRGVGAVLGEAGYIASSFDTTSAWQPGKGGRAVFVFVDDAAAVPALTEFAEDHPHIPMIAVAQTLGVAEFAALIRAGAISALAEDEPIALILATLEHVLAGRASAPTTILQALSMRVAAGFGETLAVPEVDIARIRDLASGSTVARLAAAAGFSEREMFRLLGDLYQRIGVSNRTEAILWASRHGLLDDE